MAVVTVAEPVNAAQIIDAVGAECTVRENTDAGTAGIDVPSMTADQINAKLAGLVYDPNYLSPPAANAATLRQRAFNALTANANYQSIATPTNAQVVAQVALLTKECNGIIRLLLNQLDSTSGT